METEIFERCWYKRRAPTAEKKAVSVVLVDCELINNSFCTMIVSWNDNSQERLIGRVIYNTIKHYWTVDGMKVAVKIINRM